MAKKQIIEIIRKYILLLKQEGVGIEQAYLYGSHANGTATKESDIDLLLVLKDIDNEDDYLSGKIWALTRKINTRIEPYIVGFEQFNKDNVSPLMQSIKKESLPVC